MLEGDPDEKVREIDEDLSPLTGQRVDFDLMTRALREHDNGLGVWVAPRLWR